jgi:hypothetical protein
MCHFYIMLRILLKKIINFKDKSDLDARFWIQKALLYKNFKNKSF